MSDSLTPGTACHMPGFPVLHYLAEFAQIHEFEHSSNSSIESVMPTKHFILCYTFLLLLSIFPRIRDFSSESALHIRWSKCWSFSISPSNAYSELIFFRIDCLDILAVQETLKSLLQHQNSKASILQCSAFLMVQLSYPYMTTGKTIVFTIWTFVGKVLSVLLNTLSRFVIAFLPRNTCL